MRNSRQVTPQLPCTVRMLLAGLWDRWTDPETSEVVDSCAIVTTEANELLKTVPHDRSPVILSVDAAHEWLETSSAKTTTLERLFVPAPLTSSR